MIIEWGRDMTEREIHRRQELLEKLVTVFECSDYTLKEVIFVMDLLRELYLSKGYGPQDDIDILEVVRADPH